MNELKITTLGAFSISCGNAVVSENDNRTRKIWRLIKYLVASRGRKLTYEEISDAVGIRENTDSASAVKTMLHRARNTLKTLGFSESRGLILQEGGRYFWNTDIHQIIDEDKFSEYINSADKALSAADAFNKRRAALEMYKGYYLDRAFDDIPALAERIREYHIAAINAFESAASYMLANSMQEELCTLALKMIGIDPYQETFHYYLIKACIDLNKNENALLYYNRVSELFAGKFKVSPSDRMKTLYRYIASDSRITENDVNVIKDELLDDTDSALFCDYACFKHLCGTLSMHCRAKLVLLSLEPKNDRTVPGEVRLKNALSALKEILSSSLSKGDAFTLYSANQYIALISSSDEMSFTDNISRDFAALENIRSLRLSISSTELI